MTCEGGNKKDNCLTCNYSNHRVFSDIDGTCPC